MPNENLKKALRPKKEKSAIPAKNYLSTGSTTLNLACSSRINGGYFKGGYFYLVGDTGSGKTWFTMSALAEASINPEFDDYQLIHDNVEHGALMKLRKYFGQRLADRIGPPQGTKDDPVYSATVEEFFDNLDDLFKEGRPFIYILDSADGLTTKDEEQHYEKEKRARRSGKEVTGSYGMSRPKQFSAKLRIVCNKLRRSGSILIIVSQTRDRVGPGAMFDPNTRAGGRALSFWSQLEIWTSVLKRFKKKVGFGSKKKDRVIGREILCKVKKNRITGRDVTCRVPIYFSVGIDDMGACVDYLIEEGHWKGTKSKVVAPEFDFRGLKEDLISKIEEGEQQTELRSLVGQVWKDIEAQCSIQRKSKYD